MLASTVGVFFLSKRLTLIFIWEARVTYVAVRALEAHRCGQGSYHRRKIELIVSYFYIFFRSWQKLHVLFQLEIR